MKKTILFITLSLTTVFSANTFSQNISEKNTEQKRELRAIQKHQQIDKNRQQQRTEKRQYRTEQKRHKTERKNQRQRVEKRQHRAEKKGQYQKIKPEIDAAIQEVVESAYFVGGPQVKQFQQNLEKYLGVKHVIPCANGTDALQVALMALDLKEGDEVITTSFTFIATGEMIALLGAKPVFVDIDPKTYNIDPSKIKEAISTDTKAIMPVSLYGQCADFDAINAIADKHGIPVIEDAAQEAKFPKQLLQGLAEIGAFGSFIPEEYGGANLDQISYGLIMQEIERGDSGVRSTASVQSSLVMYPIWKYGNEEQRQKYLAKLASGELIGCFGLTEPNHGSNPAGMETRFKDMGDHYLLNGAKLWISNSPFADIAVVWAKNEEGRIHGLLVERGMEGFSTPETHNKWSLRASLTGELVFDNVKIPPV